MPDSSIPTEAVEAGARTLAAIRHGLNKPIDPLDIDRADTERILAAVRARPDHTETPTTNPGPQAHNQELLAELIRLREAYAVQVDRKGLDALYERGLVAGLQMAIGKLEDK